jgi:hypothetical protein
MEKTLDRNQKLRKLKIFRSSVEKLPPGFICRTKKSEGEAFITKANMNPGGRPSATRAAFLVLFHPLGFYRQRCEKCKERGSPKV